MNIIFQTVIQYIAEIVGLVIISAIGILGTWILSKINKTKKLDNISYATEFVISAAQETVRRLQQTLVDDYKEAAADGKLTDEQILELKTKVQIITLEQLGDPILQLLASAKIDVSDLITNAAEAFINKLKEEEE